MGAGLTIGAGLVGDALGGIFDAVAGIFGGGNDEQHYLDLLAFARSQGRSAANRTPPSNIPDAELVAWAQMIHTQNIENPLRQEILEALKVKYTVQNSFVGGQNLSGFNLGGLSLTNPVVLIGAGALAFLLIKK